MTEFETGHADSINDLQIDYYGRRVATASSDTTIRIFDLSSSPPTFLADLRGHRGPVWKVAWAHPKFGSVLASCSFDSTVIVWSETESGWIQAFQSSPSAHTASVNGVDWASHELGQIVGSASSDGSVCIFTYGQDGTWNETKIPGVDAVSCTSISCAPSGRPDSLSENVSEIPSSMRCVIGGCENHLKIICMTQNGWQVEKKLMAHSDWVLDVAWAPDMAAIRHCIASAGQDGKVIVWKENQNGTWEHNLVHAFDVPVYRVRWSVTGNLLSVSDKNHEVTLWKESHSTGKWTQITE